MAGRSPWSTRPLPVSLPLFPLTGVLLLPRGLLPLNIFESRYLNMVDDALAGDRLIGMIQPSDPEPQGFNPPLHRIGCAGRITSFEEDGERYLITLTGVSRFDVTAEVGTTKLYRRAVPGWAPYADDLTPDSTGPVDRPRLITGLKQYFQLRGLQVDWKALEATTDDRLVTTMAMVCPFGPVEKQNLLQAGDLPERAKLLTGLVEMALLEQPGGGSLRH